MQIFTVWQHLDIDSNLLLGLCSQQLLRSFNQFIGKGLIYNNWPSNAKHVRKISACPAIDYASSEFDNITHLNTGVLQCDLLPRHLKYLQTACGHVRLQDSLISLKSRDAHEIRKLDNHPYLTKLHMHGNTRLDVQLPPNLTDLRLAAQTYVIGAFPKSLTILKLAKEYNHELPCFPECLVWLHMGRAWNHPLPMLPDTLEHLVLSCNFTYPIPSLPHKLRYLDLGGVWNEAMPKLPETLETLRLSLYLRDVITYLPSHVHRLEVYSNVTFLLDPCLSVTYLTISNRTISLADLPGLFPNVETVHMFDCRNVLPCFPHVKTLDFEMRNWPSNWKGWTSLTSLTVRDCVSDFIHFPPTARRIHLDCCFPSQNNVAIEFDLPDATTFLELIGPTNSSFHVRISPQSRLRHLKLKKASLKIVPHFPKTLQFMNGDPKNDKLNLTSAKFGHSEA